MDDFESLNLTDLDVEELEQRIELGLLIPDLAQRDGSDCTTFSPNCTTLSSCGTFGGPA